MPAATGLPAAQALHSGWSARFDLRGLPSGRYVLWLCMVAGAQIPGQQASRVPLNTVLEVQAA